MGIASEIRANLPLCSRCINCNLLVLEEKEELKNTSNLIKFKSLDSAYYYMVRCSWLKSPVNEPNFLEVHEGKQAYGAKL